MDQKTILIVIVWGVVLLVSICILAVIIDWIYHYLCGVFLSTKELIIGIFALSLFIIPLIPISRGSQAPIPVILSIVGIVILLSQKSSQCPSCYTFRSLSRVDCKLKETKRVNELEYYTCGSHDDQQRRWVTKTVGYYDVTDRCEACGEKYFSTIVTKT